MALDPITSQTRWIIEDEPAIRAPPSSNGCPRPQFLPDPRDGSIYKLQGLGELTKLPYTIPQLVASAPCKSSDGILYSGKKKDTWFLIDPLTGRREKVLGFGIPPEENVESIGWATTRSVYLGRTQYTVLMVDSKSKDKKPWNITFYDYASHTMAPELSNDYEYLHLSSSESGALATFERKSGKLVWQKKLTSPVIAVFLLGPEGLLSVPFHTVSERGLQDAVSKTDVGNEAADIDLYPSLYVGEHGKGGLFALSSHVSKDEPIISQDSSVKAIAGPENEPELEDFDDTDNLNVIKLDQFLLQQAKIRENIVVLGHYKRPRLEIDPKLKLGTTQSQAVATLPPLIFDKRNNFIIQSDKAQKTISGTENNTEADKTHDSRILKSLLLHMKHWVDSQENKILKVLLIIAFGMVISMLWYLHITVKELKQQSQTGSNGFLRSSGVTSELEDLGDGDIRIGKITFNPNHVLGKGCEGTFVFKGAFEQRNVAVKRLLPECFTLADREVSLLRESDAHENVVRYFCTEQDRQFKYIAVELCAATLQDYVEGPRANELKQQIDKLDILYQASSGLMHLHSLNIVHRDIKPQNVLLSLPDRSNRIRAMISDFGLCKKLNLGKASFSRRSGVTGTDGWIAPEMVKGHRTTTAIDIFSLGCVFYYVITNGAHPFGDTLKRQSNILSHEYDLKLLKPTTHEQVLAEELIKDMINEDAGRRPLAPAILKHPIFWNEEKILAFLQDVSDRVEKAELTTEPLRSLERNARHVVRDDWRSHLDPAIEADLKKYRGYQGISVRDLLRALRNKKHHYHELDPDIQESLGTMPIEFTRYWIDRFPHLVSHSYHAYSICSTEHIFKPYYHNEYKFTCPSYLTLPEFDNIKLMAYYEGSLKKSPKRSKNNNNSPKPQKSPYTSRKTESDNLNNRRGKYNFKRDETVEGFITRDQMANFNNKITITNRHGPTPKPEDNLVWEIAGKGKKKN